VGAAREWFQRLFSYFPGIQFTVRHVIVQGWPWNTLVATQLSVAAPRADGSMYRNEVMQFLHLRWGKVVEDRLYEDTWSVSWGVLVIGEDFGDHMAGGGCEHRVGVQVVGEGDEPDGECPAPTSRPRRVIYLQR